jgi:hypothetical protein
MSTSAMRWSTPFSPDMGLVIGGAIKTNVGSKGDAKSTSGMRAVLASGASSARS